VSTVYAVTGVLVMRRSGVRLPKAARFPTSSACSRILLLADFFMWYKRTTFVQIRQVFRGTSGPSLSRGVQADQRPDTPPGGA
jgi:hypothetical protein